LAARCVIEHTEQEMASKSPSTYGNDAPITTDRSGVPVSPGSDRPGKRPTSAPTPALSAILQDTRAVTRPPASFDPWSAREALVATAAYYRAERRGFRPGHELEDWLAAERDVDGAGGGPPLT
jgi:hypothetical protein